MKLKHKLTLASLCIFSLIAQPLAGLAQTISAKSAENTATSDSYLYWRNPFYLTLNKTQSINTPLAAQIDMPNDPLYQYYVILLPHNVPATYNALGFSYHFYRAEVGFCAENPGDPPNTQDFQLSPQFINKVKVTGDPDTSTPIVAFMPTGSLPTLPSPMTFPLATGTTVTLPPKYALTNNTTLTLPAGSALQTSTENPSVFNIPTGTSLAIPAGTPLPAGKDVSVVIPSDIVFTTPADSTLTLPKGVSLPQQSGAQQDIPAGSILTFSAPSTVASPAGTQVTLKTENAAVTLPTGAEKLQVLSIYPQHQFLNLNLTQNRDLGYEVSPQYMQASLGKVTYAHKNQLQYMYDLPLVVGESGSTVKPYKRIATLGSPLPKQYPYASWTYYPRKAQPIMFGRQTAMVVIRVLPTVDKLNLYWKSTYDYRFLKVIPLPMWQMANFQSVDLRQAFRNDPLPKTAGSKTGVEKMVRLHAAELGNALKLQLMQLAGEESLIQKAAEKESKETK